MTQATHPTVTGDEGADAASMAPCPDSPGMNLPIARALADETQSGIELHDLLRRQLRWAAAMTFVVLAGLSGVFLSQMSHQKQWVAMGVDAVVMVVVVSLVAAAWSRKEATLGRLRAIELMLFATLMVACTAWLCAQLHVGSVLVT